MKKNTFGDFLRIRRQQCGLSQYQLGMLLKVSDKAVSKWENNLARPKSQLLYQLSVILGVTVDELLTGGEHPDCKGKSCLTKERHKYLWNKAYGNLMERYADMPPIEAISRFESEKLAFMNTDMILFFDLLAQMSESALRKGYPIHQEGGIGASFVAYLLGASVVNPLPAHYYCPVCKKVEFVSGASDGWELDSKYCNGCHSFLVRDGHNIPFEVYRHVIGKNAGFNLVVSRHFYEEAEERIIQYFGAYMTVILNPPIEVAAKRNLSKMVTYAIQPSDINEKTEKDSVSCSYEEYYNFISDRPYINLIFMDDYEKYIELRRLVKVSETEIDFLDEQVQQALFKGDINGIPDFGLWSLPRLFGRFSVKNMGDALKLYGIALCVSALSEYEAASYINRETNLSEVIPYRDDIFLYISSKMEEHGYLEKGLAFRVMDQTRKGFYYRSGVDRYTRKLLLDIGVSEQYLTCLEKTAYLFPKAQGIIQIRYTLILLWYRIYYPEEFQHVIKEGIKDFERKDN